MRFERLLLERYGPFTDRALELRPQARLHVVVGANEAGKTSTLNAIGDFLFGFGHTTAYDFLHDKTSLRIGAQLRLADGSQLALRRRKGAKNTLLDENDGPLAADPLAPLLGSVTREIFFSEFGLTSESLRAGGRELLRAGGRLAETLAASSAQLSALAQLRARLSAEAEELFGPRRSRKPFYDAYDQYKDAETHLRDAIVTAEALEASRRAVDEAKEKRGTLTAEHERIGRELALLHRSQRTRPKLSRIAILREQLAGLADLPEIEAETLSRWRRAQDEATQIEKDLAQVQAEDAAAGAEAAALDVDETLLEQGEHIERLRQDLGAVLKHEEDLPKRLAEARGAREDLRKAAAELGLADEEQLLGSQPTAPQLALVRELVGQRVAAERALCEAEAARGLARRELEELESEVAGLEAATDPAPLSQRLSVFADIPADADRLRRSEAALAHERRTLEEEADRLDPPGGDPQQLARRILPDALQIEASRRLFAQLDEEEKQAAARAGDLAASLQRIEEEIAQLSLAGAMATREELGEERRRRDELFQRLGLALDKNESTRRECFSAVGEAIRSVDAAADILLADADRSARYESARERRGRQLLENKSAQAAREEVARRREEALQSWAELWAPSGVSPKPPRNMARWLERVEDMLKRRADIEQRAHENEALRQKLESCASGLRRLLNDMTGDGDDPSPVEALYRLARAALDRRQAAWSETRASVAVRDKARKTAEKAERDLAGATAEAANVRQAWPAALAPVGLDGAATPKQAEAALAIWQSVPARKDRLSDLDHRIHAMQRDIAAFEQKTAALVERAAPDLRGRPRRDALDILYFKLGDARRARDKREDLRTAARRRDSKRAELLQHSATAQRVVGEARAALALEENAALTPCFVRLESRFSLRDELDRALRDLCESADGLEEAALRDEQANVEFGMLDGAIERQKIDARQTLDDLQRAAAAQHEAEKALETLSAGRDAAGAALERAEAGVRLGEIATRWLVRAAAARLAAQTIERHRAAVQNPLLKRASELFSIATDRAYASLGADFDENDAPSLIGIRENGARVPVSGMSEGARDQLFLSLRLALLELRAAEPLPFIGDDLLASFDERRTACALGLLAEFGRKRQAILFTHHRHVAEIAQRLPGADIDVVEF
ncbi:ATP-binding protein [Methylocystis heyeri]|uniref:AAA family ATPase n=1 Tax=Methylocystis heyeri TaxID=391905 RepID=A0A6B8KF93_9HYPH|nr:YhaN family protein [Methylocystis heyeri]QGM45625.1 AAA family ATPase [Methylocystis heyeri]